MDEIRFNNPEGNPGENQGATPEAQEAKPKKKGKAKSWILFLIVAIIVVALGYTFRDKLTSGGAAVINTGATSDYQSVFLTNGQVYFGKVSKPNADYVVMKDVFYLQVIQPPLQGSDSEGSSSATSDPQISLVKLGNELHGPVDEMHINRDHILFYEDLKEDSQVVQAIANFKANAGGN